MQKTSNIKLIQGPTISEIISDYQAWDRFIQVLPYVYIVIADEWKRLCLLNNNIPIRKDMDQGWLMKNGSKIILFKSTNDNRLQVTYQGSDVVDSLEADFTHKYLDDITQDQNLLEKWQEAFHITSTQNRPVILEYNMEWIGKSYFNCKDVCLPLKSADTQFSDMILNMIVINELH